MSTLFFSFEESEQAARALGSLHDRGVSPHHMSMVVNEDDLKRIYSPKAVSLAMEATEGISLTTADDAATGTLKGSALGLAAGFLGGLASLFIPGYGLVLGGGALATASAAALGTGAGGAVTGCVYGYLRDQGLEEETISTYETQMRAGGALISVDLDATTVPREEVEKTVAKYQPLDARLTPNVEAAAHLSFK